MFGSDTIVSKELKARRQTEKRIIRHLSSK